MTKKHDKHCIKDVGKEETKGTAEKKKKKNNTS